MIASTGLLSKRSRSKRLSGNIFEWLSRWQAGCTVIPVLLKKKFQCTCSKKWLGLFIQCYGVMAENILVHKTCWPGSACTRAARLFLSKPKGKPVGSSPTESRLRMWFYDLLHIHIFDSDYLSTNQSLESRTCIEPACTARDPGFLKQTKRKARRLESDRIRHSWCH